MTIDVRPVKESHIIFVAALIQFVNMVDFVMVMPLGPDFATALNIPVSDIGMIGGVYALAAGVIGLIGSFFLDNFARKKAILFFLAGLSIATLGGALAWDKSSMLAARVLAGLFGGPVAALTMALIADYIPPQRRGQAIGKVMGAFSLASIIGIPIGLELARVFSWHAPFIAVSALGAVAFVITCFVLPNRDSFVKTVLFKDRLIAMGQLLKTRIVLLSYALVVISMAMGFSIIPNISAHYQYNLNYPREQLGLLYFSGGFFSFFSMRLAGKWVDRSGISHIILYATLLFIAAMLATYIYYPSGGFDGLFWPVFLAVIFMIAMTTRNICFQTISSKIPPPEYRGAYMSLQTAIVHFSQALAAWVSIGFAVVIPIFFYMIKKRLKTEY